MVRILNSGNFAFNLKEFIRVERQEKLKNEDIEIIYSYWVKPGIFNFKSSFFI